MTTGEFDCIQRYLAPLTVGEICPHAPLSLRQRITFDSDNLQDDCATLGIPSDYELVINTDTVVAGVHFIGTESPQSIAQKLLAVNLSDMVAKGAYAFAYSVAMTLPPAHNHTWVEHFAEGLHQAQQQMGIVLLGGDTTAGATLTLTATMFGVVPTGTIKRRCDGRVGDDIWIVGGTIGDGYLGLQVAQEKLLFHAPHGHHFLNHYEHPQVQSNLNTLVAQYANGAMDISDGLLADARHMAMASGVALHIWADCIPLSEATKIWLSAGGPLESLLTGGDDYVVLMTANAKHRDAISQKLESLQTIGAMIGTVSTIGQSVTVYQNQGGMPLNISQKGYAHF